MSTITYKPIIVASNKRDDGSYLVVIRVTYNRKSRRLPTTMSCSSKDLTRSLKIKNETILDNARELILRMKSITNQMTFYELEGKDVDWVVHQISEGLKEENFQLDFFEWADKYILTKSESTRRAYDRALNAFERFLGERRLDINSINKMMLLDFMEFVDAEPKMHYDRNNNVYIPTDKKRVEKAASSLMLMKLQHIFKAAKDRYNDEDSDKILIPRSPFDSIKKVFPTGDKAQNPLEREVMQKLILAQTDDSSIRRALDAFVVSFALMGANLADLYYATPFKGNRWIYCRRKITRRKAEVRVDIPPQIEPYLKRLQEKGNAEWWLPILHDISSSKDECTHKLNNYLRRWQKGEGLEEIDFTMYAARHSWAQYARDLGYDLASVNECIAHKDSLEMGRIYASLSWEQKNDINRAVLESFEWE